MANIFTPGQQTTTQTPGAVSPASAAMKLFMIQLLLSRLQQTGGAPQTFGEYIKGGPRQFDTSQIGALEPGLLATLGQPGAFNAGPSVTRTQPASPSTFQDVASGAVTLALLTNLLRGGSPGGGGGIDLSGLLSRLGIGGAGASTGPDAVSSSPIDPSSLAGYTPPTAGVNYTPGDSGVTTDLLANGMSTDSYGGAGFTY
jgi:hypothetical protein